MAEEIDFENGRIQTLKGSWPWPSIRPYGISSCSSHRPLLTFIQIEETFCGRTDVRTGGLTFFPSILLGRLSEVDLKTELGWFYVKDTLGKNCSCYSNCLSCLKRSRHTISSNAVTQLTSVFINKHGIPFTLPYMTTTSYRFITFTTRHGLLVISLTAVNETAHSELNTFSHFHTVHDTVFIW